MTEWIALSRSAHDDRAYLPRNHYRHTAGQMATPILLAELNHVVANFVVGFLDSGDGLLPMAVLGIEPHQNLYLHPSGRWLGHYIPATLRGYPFVLARSHAGSEKSLCIAADHLVEEGAPLFEAGELSASVADTLAFLTRCERSHQATLAAARVLEQEGLLVPWQLTLTVSEMQKTARGLYRVDEQALNTLDADTYARLQGAPMALAYGQLYSMAQSGQLSRLAEMQEKFGSADVPESLDTVFGEDDDELRFDFDS